MGPANAKLASARTSREFRQALRGAKKQTWTSVVVVETSYDDRVPSCESSWHVPMAKVSDAKQ
jgi:TPP-dependent trihydroxycyclohexane-1,2-dione (THcHDO) dehydratase